MITTRRQKQRNSAAAIAAAAVLPPGRMLVDVVLREVAASVELVEVALDAGLVCDLSDGRASSSSTRSEATDCLPQLRSHGRAVPTLLTAT